MANEVDQTAKKKRHRSPPYPSSSLQEAVGFARTFYAAQRRNIVHLDAAMNSLGYKPNSSGGFRAIASMLAFGLIEDEGTGAARKLKLTDLGYRLMVLPDTDQDRIRLLQQAAKKPGIYAELLNYWSDGLPSDEAISKYLILDRHFNPASVPQLLADFRETLEFAQIGSSGTISESQGDTDEIPKDQRPPRERTKESSGGASMTSLVIPIREGVEAELRFPATLSKDEFDDMKDYLDTFLSVQERKLSRKSQPSDDQGSEK